MSDLNRRFFIIAFGLFIIALVSVPVWIRQLQADTLVSELSVQSERQYELATLEPDALVYTDRQFVFTEVPATLAGQIFIRGANGDKAAAQPDFLRFTLAREALVYVAYDVRATALPAWLAAWQPTGEILGTTDVPRALYVQLFGPGEVALGGTLAEPATGARSAYTVIIVPAPAAPPPPEQQPEPTPEGEMTPTSTPAELEPIEPTPEPSATPIPPAPTTPPVLEGVHDREGQQWAVIEWAFENPGVAGNPYDLLATADFVHIESGERRSTDLFYAGGSTWKLRFTGTRPGDWSFSTRSDDPDLNGLAGVVRVTPSDLPGFVEAAGSQWVRSGSGAAFVPQLVIAPNPDRLFADPSLSGRLVSSFIDQHGFNGFHVVVKCRWFDLNEERCTQLPSGEPQIDQRTFETIERLINETYAAGGMVHLWVWGDNQRGQTPKRWGVNGTVDRRLQRYIAARLGPLPGWSMGYGFDLWEWTSAAELESWHSYMHERMGWDHLLGARAGTNELAQLSESMDYASYEWHKPSYQTYRELLAARPNKPAFAEDRFRIIDNGAAKNYSAEETRRGLWHSTLAGGVANIWGNLSGGRSADDGSLAYSNAEQIKTYAEFWRGRFERGAQPCDGRSDGYCLLRPGGAGLVVYREDATGIKVSVGDLAGPLRVVAVDTKRPYAEIDLGLLNGAELSWTAPYKSDWAISIER